MWWAYKKLLIKFVHGRVIQDKMQWQLLEDLLFGIWFLFLFFQQREPRF